MDAISSEKRAAELQAPLLDRSRAYRVAHALTRLAQGRLQARLGAAAAGRREIDAALATLRTAQHDEPQRLEFREHLMTAWLVSASQRSSSREAAADRAQAERIRDDLQREGRLAPRFAALVDGR